MGRSLRKAVPRVVQRFQEETHQATPDQLAIQDVARPSSSSDAYGAAKASNDPDVVEGGCEKEGQRLLKRKMLSSMTLSAAKCSGRYMACVEATYFCSWFDTQAWVDLVGSAASLLRCCVLNR
eukprot:306460-Amphidinium_carterae.1